MASRAHALQPKASSKSASGLRAERKAIIGCKLMHRENESKPSPFARSLASLDHYSPFACCSAAIHLNASLALLCLPSDTFASHGLLKRAVCRLHESRR